MSRIPVRASSLWHPIYARRFRSALLILISREAYPRIAPADRLRVDAEAKKLNSKWSSIPYNVKQRGFEGPEDVYDLLRGIAMMSLGLPTGVASLNWSDFVRPSWKTKPVDALLSFRRYSFETDDAIDFLRSKGLELGDVSPYGKRWMEKARNYHP